MIVELTILKQSYCDWYVVIIVRVKPIEKAHAI